MALTWYCAFCAPQKEFLTSKILGDLGIESHVPQEFRYIKSKKNRKARAVVKAFPLLGARYIFIGTPDGFPFITLQKVHLLSGFVKSGEEPAVFGHESIIRLDRITKGPDNRTYSPMPSHKTFKLGDAVLITQGPFSGHLSRIVEARSGGFRVFITMLGGVQAVWLTVDQVEHP